MNRKRDWGVNATSKRRLGPRGLEATRVRPPLGVPVAQPCCFSPHSGASSGPGPGQLHTQKKQKYNFFFPSPLWSNLFLHPDTRKTHTFPRPRPVPLATRSNSTVLKVFMERPRVQTKTSPCGSPLCSPALQFHLFARCLPLWQSMRAGSAQGRGKVRRLAVMAAPRCLSPGVIERLANRRRAVFPMLQQGYSRQYMRWGTKHGFPQ